MFILIYFVYSPSRTLFFGSKARLRLAITQTSCGSNAFAADANRFIARRGVERELVARGQDLSGQWQPVALTADCDGERLLRPRTNMFRQRVAPRMRMRTCNALRNNVYARDAKPVRLYLLLTIRSRVRERRIPVARLNGSCQLVNLAAGLTSAHLP